MKSWNIGEQLQTWWKGNANQGIRGLRSGTANEPLHPHAGQQSSMEQDGLSNGAERAARDVLTYEWGAIAGRQTPTTADVG